MFEEFKKFAVRGNVLDLAVGVIIGAAFGAIVKSLVDDIIMPPIGMLIGNVDFSQLFWVLKEGAAVTGPYLTIDAARKAGAVTLNVTAVGPSAAGFLTVFPCGVAQPNSSNVNYVAGQIVPNAVITAVGASGKVCVFTPQATNLVVDVGGWFPRNSI